MKLKNPKVIQIQEQENFLEDFKLIT